MQLYSTGFNAHHQLNPHNPQPDSTISTFQLVIDSPSSPRDNIKIHAALWSVTVLEINSQLYHYGYNGRDNSTPVPITGQDARNVKTIFGDVSGVLGAVGRDGIVYVFQSNGEEERGQEGNGLVFRPHAWPESSFVVKMELGVEFVVVADNEEVCLCTHSGEGEWALHTHSSFRVLLDGRDPENSFSMPCSVIDLQASGT